MKVTATELLFFFVAVNLACAFLTSAGIFPDVETEATNAKTTEILGMFTVDFVALAVSASIPTLIGLMSGALVQGIIVGLITATLTFFLPIFNWVLYGIPSLLSKLAIPTPIPEIIMVMCGVIWSLYFVNIIAQRYADV